MARPNPLADPDFAMQVARVVADGDSLSVIAEVFGITTATARRWRKDPRVKRPAMKMIEDRVLEITRKVDSRIAALLEDSSLDVKELLAIRKEFLGGHLRAQTEKADEETIGEMQDWLEGQDQDLVDKLLTSFERAKTSE